ncbi:MAG TPA: hypothetical protein VFD27_22845 [Chthoniobacteraceae bacterium]|nr:hypothetical protein [Chthoniobacteraceae bacterium]
MKLLQKRIAMYHWFLLLSLPRDATVEQRPVAALKFFHSFDHTGSLSSSDRCRLFLLGAIEFIPVLSGGIGATYVESVPLQSGFVAGGIILCAILCWLLRDKTPLTRIHTVNKTEAKRPQTSLSDNEHDSFDRCEPLVRPISLRDLESAQKSNSTKRSPRFHAGAPILPESSTAESPGTHSSIG